MTETLAYTIRKASDAEFWSCKSDAWPHLEGTGRTEHLAIDHLKKLVEAEKPTLIGLYETTNIGHEVNLRGVCRTLKFAQDWVAENDPSKTWESRSFHPIAFLEPYNKEDIAKAIYFHNPDTGAGEDFGFNEERAAVNRYGKQLALAQAESVIKRLTSP